MHPTPTDGDDSLNMLFGAAMRDDRTSREDPSQSHPHDPLPSNTQMSNPAPGSASPGTEEMLMRSPDHSTKLKISTASNETLNLWNTCRFVRMGWFAAYEAITLVDA